MESKIKNQKLYKISEIRLIYKNLVKAPLRPHVDSPKEAYEIVFKIGIQIKLNLLNSLKYYY